MSRSSHPAHSGHNIGIAGERSGRHHLKPGDGRSSRGRYLAVGFVLVCGLLIAAGVFDPAGVVTNLRGGPSPSAIQPGPMWSATTASVPASPSDSQTPQPTPVPVVSAGTGAFSYADGEGPVAGAGGAVVHYQVAVEGGLGIDATDFAAEVESVLADPRSWTAGGSLRLQRVAPSTAAEFTVMLASPVTSEQLCRTEGMETEQYTSCRLHGRVVINSARWLTGVPDYGAPLAVYRAYAINHEVGHQLGQGHELCPGPGRPAPVMEQQTLGLQGCVANPWPYVDGVRYTGPQAAA